MLLFVRAGVCLAVLSLGLCVGVSHAQGSSDDGFLPGKWTADVLASIKPGTDGSEESMQQVAAEMCITIGANTVTSLDETFLKVYYDRQCGLSNETFSEINSVQMMEGDLICGPLSGSLKIGFTPTSAVVTSYLSGDIGRGDMTIYNHAKWVSTRGPC